MLLAANYFGKANKAPPINVSTRKLSIPLMPNLLVLQHQRYALADQHDNQSAPTAPTAACFKLTDAKPLAL